jgi:uncharacterized protein YcfJ
MNRLTASILALGLAATAGTVSAQSSGYYPQQYGSQYGSQYGQPVVDRYGQGNGAYYDYARVLRVDPVMSSGYGYPTSNSQRCYTRQDSYAGNDGYNNGYYGNDGYNNDGYNNGYNGGYRNDGYSNNGYRSTTAGSNVATVIGGLLGAAVGSQVGGGSARYATAAIGSMVGGMAGRQVYENSRRTRYPRTGVVQVCDPVPVGYGSNNGYNNGNGYYAGNGGVSAYDVTYQYGGRNYTTRTNYNPGNRIRVRVDVRPE